MVAVIRSFSTFNPFDAFSIQGDVTTLGSLTCPFTFKLHKSEIGVIFNGQTSSILFRLLLETGKLTSGVIIKAQELIHEEKTIENLIEVLCCSRL